MHDAPRMREKERPEGSSIDNDTVGVRYYRSLSGTDLAGPEIDRTGVTLSMESKGENLRMRGWATLECCHKP